MMADRPPARLAIGKGVLRLLSLQAADRSWELAVSEADIALVRAALRGHGTEG
ncbi:hypothetical protein ACFT0G_20525 [Streptomyces sp. NPDC057020]|uniref:hypothetical protein n=2 Tax=unclassified Streptomyces TaxID=2593676 RepID=UPI0036301093